MKQLKDFIKQIDKKLDSYDPGDLEPDKIVKEIFEYRAQQAPMLSEAIELCNQGLNKYPYNPELLRRKAIINTLIVTPEGEYPKLEQAENDLRKLLELSPNDLHAAYELLQAMFTFSGMEDSDIADLAGDFSSRAEKLMISLKALQIKALSYADRKEECNAVYDKIIQLYPDNSEIKNAKSDTDELTEN